MKPHRLEGELFPYALTERATLATFVVPPSPEGYRLALVGGDGASERPFTTTSLRLAEDLARGVSKPRFVIQYGPAPEKDPSP